MLSTVPYSCTLTRKLFYVRHSLILLALSVRSIFGFSIQTLYPECFKKSAVRTEAVAYALLKKNPLSVETTYLAVPWETVMSDPNYRNKIIEDLERLNFNGGFTIVNNLSWYGHILLPIFEKIGIDHVFTPCTRYGQDTYNAIRIIAFPYHAKNKTKPRRRKDILYSFIGSTPSWLIAHPVRQAIFSMEHPSGTVIKQRTKFLDAAGVAEYKDILARSRYCLCPPGNMPLPDKLGYTAEPGMMRLYEALSAGAIPVLVNDSWRLPGGIDWDACLVRIPESQVYEIPKILASISQETELRKRYACLKTFAALSGDNFIAPVRLVYDSENLRLHHKDRIILGESI